MYYYGNTGYYGGGYGAQGACGAPTYAGYTSGYGIGAAIWIIHSFSNHFRCWLELEQQ